MRNPSKPFSTKPKELKVVKLNSGYSYAFDFANPGGIKLLPPKVGKRFKFLQKHGESFSSTNQIDSSLASSGLLMRGDSQLKKNEPKSKSVSVWLHIINGCNFSCSYCYIPHLRKVVNQSTLNEYGLSTGSARSIAENLISYCRITNTPALHIKFAGGEPTLDINNVKNFCEYVNSRSVGLKVTYGMITNGSFDFNEVCNVLLEHISNVSISIDGYKESHDALRFSVVNKQKVGSWDKIWSNVELMLKSGIKPYFLYTITHSNFRDIYSFSRKVHSYGLGYRLSLVRSRKPYDFDTINAITLELTKLYKFLGEDLDVSLPIGRYAKFSEWNLTKRKYLACSSCRSYFAIDHKGNVASCQMNLNNPVGNLNNDNLINIKQEFSEQVSIKDLVDPENRVGVCPKCEYFHICAGGCPQHTIMAKNSTLDSSIWCYTYGSLVPNYLSAIANQMKRKAMLIRSESRC